MNSRNIKRTALAVLFLLCRFAADGQQVYTLEMCRETALKNNRTVAAAHLAVDKTNYDSKSFLANFFPKISASGLYMYTNTEFKQNIGETFLPTYVFDPAKGELVKNLYTLPDGRPLVINGQEIYNVFGYFPAMNLNLALNGTWFAGVQAEQPLFMGGKIISAYKMSKTGKEIAALNVKLTGAEIILETDEAYFRHVKALESRKVAVAYRTVVSELLQNIEAARRAGMKTQNDVLKVQVQANRAELQLQRAENGIRLSGKNLCRIMGLPLNSDIEIENNLGEHKTSLPESTGFQARPEYTILEKQVELKRHQVQIVRSDFLPEVGLTANYGYMRGMELNSVPLVDRASFSALLSVKIPIFHWGEGINKIRAAKAEKQITEMQREDMNEKMELETQQLLDHINESHLEIELTARALEQAEENMRTSRNHYENGMETLAGYLESQTLWQQAWLENIEAQINLKLNETRYLKAVGKL
jgi:outer membrane protein TolC